MYPFLLFCTLKHLPPLVEILNLLCLDGLIHKTLYLVGLEEEELLLVVLVVGEGGG